MEYCKGCVMYNPQMDDIGQLWNDTDKKDKHFCPMYDNGIPKGIAEDKEKCQYFEDK